MTSPMQRSLELLRKEGFYAEIVEHFNTFSKRRNDFLGFADIFCIDKATGDIRLVQTTSDSNVAARVDKITSHENLSLARKAGMTVHVHGWRKRRKDRRVEWSCRVVDIS